MVEGGFLLVSESAETLLAAIQSIRKNEVLPKTDVWQNLSRPPAGGVVSGSAALSLFYSLDRSLPFFLKGNAASAAILGIFRQGLLRLSMEDGVLSIALSLIPGYGTGVAAAPGYPLELGDKPGGRVFAVPFAKKNESRILLTRGNSVLSVDPANNTLYEYPGSSLLWAIPAEGLAPKTVHESAVWAVNSQGRVALLNGNLETARGFPLVSGLRLSSPPAAHGGKLYLCDEDGAVYSVTIHGELRRWETIFPAALRSPPSFYTSGSHRVLAALYPKSFLGELWLLDISGKVLPGWPSPVSGIAFGSPLLFSQTVTGAKTVTGTKTAADGKVLLAFITQAGELSVLDESAVPFPGFPRSLSGVFFIQPVWDGEYLWALSGEGVLYRIGLDASILEQKIPNLIVREESYITAVDVDGDKIPEIFFSGEGNALYGYSRNFSALDGFPLPLWGRPAFADFDGDGKLECAGAGLDNRLYRWHFR
jgi:outer membrane protein assembly factor BamB